MKEARPEACPVGPFAWLRLLLALLCAAASQAATIDQVRGIVVDQTGLGIPGVTLELRDGATLVSAGTSAADGTFVLDGAIGKGTLVIASLTGFATVRVPPTQAARIVLTPAAVNERATVSASSRDADAPTGERIGSSLSGATLQRVPTARQHVRDALPLLPSVMRGPDGLLHVDGARPHEAPLLLDGFNVTDPATGVSAIDLPVESVSRVDVLRDPAAVTFGSALGPLVSIETVTGTERLAFGAQGFVPRLRYGKGGFGRIEGFFPRSYVGGQARGGRVRYFAAGEFDYERVRVPGVTAGRGSPDTRETSATLFGRADVQLSAHHTFTAEGIYFPGRAHFHRLSPLRATTASPTLDDRDLFLGIVDRHVLTPASLLIVRVGLLEHATALNPTSTLAPELTPLGWRGGSFSTLDRRASRVSASVAWQQRLDTARWGTHALTVESTFGDERLRGTIDERTVDLRDAEGRLLRRMEFGQAGRLAASARSVGTALRDSWRVNDVLQIDGGMRVDWSSLGGGATPSARVGIRYLLPDGLTTLTSTTGRFVGTLPLMVPAFAGYPTRIDTQVDPLSGDVLRSTVFVPSRATLALPRAWVTGARLERRLAPGWDAQVGASLRRSSHLATLDVQPDAGVLDVASRGRATYHEVEGALRHTWGEGDELFVSYTRSSARGEVNDFATLFGAADVEVLRPGGQARQPADAPHRWLGWFTVTLPKGFIVAPVAEWHSGFPYSPLTASFDYAGAPGSASFPAFFSLDLGLFKTVNFRERRIKAGVQVFNVTNHANPRDVYAVPGTPRYGSFTNSVGPTLRGVLTFVW